MKQTATGPLLPTLPIAGAKTKTRLMHAPEGQNHRAVAMKESQHGYQYDVDHEPHGQTPPRGTLFDDGYTTTTNRAASSANPLVGVHTGNFYTPLYTESQETCHTNVNTIQ